MNSLRDWVRKNCRFAAEPPPLGSQAPAPLAPQPSKKDLVHEMDARIDRSKRPIDQSQIRSEEELMSLIRSLPNHQLTVSLAKSIQALQQLVAYIRDPNFPTIKSIFEQKFQGLTPEQVIDLTRKLNEFVMEVSRYANQPVIQ